MLKIATEPKFRRRIAVDETELKVKGDIVYYMFGLLRMLTIRGY